MVMVMVYDSLQEKNLMERINCEGVKIIRYTPKVRTKEGVKSPFTIVKKGVVEIYLKEMFYLVKGKRYWSTGNYDRVKIYGVKK